MREPGQRQQKSKRVWVIRDERNRERLNAPTVSYGTKYIRSRFLNASSSLRLAVVVVAARTPEHSFTRLSQHNKNNDQNDDYNRYNYTEADPSLFPCSTGRHDSSLGVLNLHILVSLHSMVLNGINSLILLSYKNPEDSRH
ncbi:hypothetical protein AG1IA_01207 [Rhizoctonia solani AG-1 IA]|uniref:Uncharacterized protein n=1 Tax=Thanatephorus cucumeris (strain AG1-IA) TaxID=983506 RepID=L8X6Y3_THACA|nr:hypothetical protein AG1IA_01207 [Rhizoctonia solani AG-1 IA]